MRQSGGFNGGADGRGLHVTKLPENDNRANLTDLTIRTSAFMQSERKEGPAEMIDEENGGFQASLHR